MHLPLSKIDINATHIGLEGIPNLWAQPYDIVVLANENKCEGFDPKTLNCKFVVESIDGVLTNSSVNTLSERGICVMPDLLVNAGSLPSDYFEWLINLKLLKYSKMTETLEGLENKKMADCLVEYFKELSSLQRDLGVLHLEEARDTILKMSNQVVQSGVDGVIEKALRLRTNLKLAGYTLGFENLVKKYQTKH